MRTLGDRLKSFHREFRNDHVEAKNALVRRASYWVDSYSLSHSRQLLKDLAGKLRDLEHDPEK